MGFTGSLIPEIRGKKYEVYNVIIATVCCVTVVVVVGDVDFVIVVVVGVC